MNRFTLAAVLFLAGCIPTPSQTTSIGPSWGGWKTDCSVDSMTDEKSCTVTRYVNTRTLYDTAVVGISASPLSKGTLVAVTAGNGLCPGKPPMIRIDSDPAVRFKLFEGVGVLPSEAGTALAERMKTGGTMLVRVYIWPECISREVNVSLGGFAAAWDGAVRGGL